METDFVAHRKDCSRSPLVVSGLGLANSEFSGTA